MWRRFWVWQTVPQAVWTEGGIQRLVQTFLLLVGYFLEDHFGGGNWEFRRVSSFSWIGRRTGALGISPWGPWETPGSEGGTSASASAWAGAGPSSWALSGHLEHRHCTPVPCSVTAPCSSFLSNLVPLRPLPDASPRASGTCVKLNSFWVVFVWSVPLLFLNYYVSLVGNELTLIMIVEGFYFQKDFGRCKDKRSSLHAWLIFCFGRVLLSFHREFALDWTFNRNPCLYLSAVSTAVVLTLESLRADLEHPSTNFLSSVIRSSCRWWWSLRVKQCFRRAVRMSPVHHCLQVHGKPIFNIFQTQTIL